MSQPDTVLSSQESEADESHWAAKREGLWLEIVPWVQSLGKKPLLQLLQGLDAPASPARPLERYLLGPAPR